MAMVERQLRRVIDLLGDHAPSAVVAILVTELFYKFHSFTLECIAFLATWYLVDQLVARPYASARRRFGLRLRSPER